jgi:ATP-dependent DNA helicase Rep
MKLNDAQQRAVDCTDGPCLVLAGAGSGKTRVITAKITALIRRKGLEPESVCAVTFTNKAAREMQERVAGDLGAEIAGRVSVSTFHSLGLSIIRKEHARFGLSKNFSLFDQYDQEKIVRDLIREKFPQLLTDSSERSLVENACASISRWKSSLISPGDLEIGGAWPRMCYRLYDRYLKACNALDFEDLLFLTTRALRDDADFRDKWQSVFRYVLVDEYQDTNETQYQFLKLLTGRYRCFTVVGDDDQSIYSWRGARPENLKVLAQDYPDLTVIKLEENYRSTARILRCANALIAHNEHVFDKKLRSALGEGAKIQVQEVATEDDQAERIAQLIWRHKYHNKSAYRDYAVLYRSNFQSRAIEKAFRENHIPCVITGGTSFFEQQEVKDLMGWCRVLCNPRDDAALLRVINVPRRGIGAESIAVIAEIARANGKSMYDSMLQSVLAKKLNARQMQAVSSFMILLTNLRQMLMAKQDEKVARVLTDHLGYERYLKACSDSDNAAEFKIKNAKTLMEWIADLCRGTRGRDPLTFIEAVDKLGLREMLDRSTDAADADAVQLMTLHAAKGLEFPYVFMAGVEEGILPHRSSFELQGGIDEERRLCYVGVTRAKRELTMLLCRQRKIRAQDLDTGIRFNTPSRFIYEMPQEDLAWTPLGKVPSEATAARAERVNRAAAKLQAMIDRLDAQ